MTEKPKNYSHVKRMKMVVSGNMKHYEKKRNIEREVGGCRDKSTQPSKVQGSS